MLLLAIVAHLAATSAAASLSLAVMALAVRTNILLELACLPPAAAAGGAAGVFCLVFVYCSAGTAVHRQA